MDAPEPKLDLLKAAERALNELDPIVERILIDSPWFKPFAPHAITPDSIGAHFLDVDEASITKAIDSLLKSGLVLPSTNSIIKAEYRASPLGLILREQLMRKRKLRHPALIHQKDHSLESLVVALLMVPLIRNQVISGGFLAESNTKTDSYLCFYLDAFSAADVRSACSGLLAKGLLAWETGRPYINGEPVTGREISPRGQREYYNRIARELQLEPGRSILDRVADQREHREHIALFWIWQADYPMSRKQINKALEDVARILNETLALKAPFIVASAVDPGGGAVRIDSQLFEKIRAADFVIADLTPVGRLHGRLLPNPNVLIEVGFALAAKDPDQVILVAANRDKNALPGGEDVAHEYPFDIANVHRINYEKPADLKRRLVEEFRVALGRRGLLEEQGSN
ncbi:nucleotide-binding protein [Pyxidicoccus caerfyrddinensis]|uniref:nucleotide-binding protein n=1 Tax=Pyxidicoccus caerfyrddinensis TaxID=2709663 RepID=UPI0013D97675|nr:nucleotide-binding protein [Pyxidicoccus caerfyrddinensis]